MKIGPTYLGVFLTGVVWLTLGGSTHALTGQAFTGATPAAGAEGTPMGANSADSSLYADGTRAINEGRWPDAEAIFGKVASQHGEHADGALYWKAYAQNKQGHSNHAFDTCAELRRSFLASSWIHECGALEIEIQAKSGKPVGPKAGDDDDLKLLALNSLMQKDETRALAQIQDILNGDASDKLKKEAMFILGQHYSDATYAQIVRISYVEGDVRIARGEQNEKPAGEAWEKAVADLPLETGFSVVTGAGRAEIEFEDASTLYLGENSVLTLNDLHTTSGIPRTEVALLTGTVTLHIRPYVAGELFTLKTPTDELSTSFPHTSYMRVSSYADGVGIAMEESGTLHIEVLGDEKLASGQTTFYRRGLRVDTAVPESTTVFADWDKWVADRVAKREAATAEVMKASGLTAPIPGMAEMAGQGRFFECAPYGTCWEPKVGDDEQQGGDKLSQSRPTPAEALRQPAHMMTASYLKPPRIGVAQAMQAADPASSQIGLDEEAYFPCYPASLRYRTMRDPVTGKEKIVLSNFDSYPYHYRWAVCHAGSWIHRRHHYVWVAGHKRHHLEPVRWVKSGHTVGFVPIHPFDVKGKPPINRRDAVFAVRDKNGLSVEQVKFDPEQEIESLAVPPKEYRTEHLAPLAPAGAPHMEARTMKDTFGGNKEIVKAVGIPLHFDPKSQSFMIAKQVTYGGKSITVMTPISNRTGNLQSRGESFAGGHGSASAGGSFRGGSGGSSGGGSHGGGGGSSASSSNSASANSSASSSGGSHH